METANEAEAKQPQKEISKLEAIDCLVRCALEKEFLERIKDKESQEEVRLNGGAISVNASRLRGIVARMDCFPNSQLPFLDDSLGECFDRLQEHSLIEVVDCYEDNYLVQITF